MDNATKVAAIKKISRAIDRMDYFEILSVRPGISSHDIRKAFLRLSRQYHPDRFFSSADPELKEAVHKIYKRISEAYHILSDPSRQVLYHQQISGPDRDKKLRYQSDVTASSTTRRDDLACTTPQGKKYFSLGLTALRQKNLGAAKMNFKLALELEPDNPAILEQLSKIDTVVKPR